MAEQPQPWSVEKLRVVLAVLAVLAVLLIAGLVFWIVRATGGTGKHAEATRPAPSQVHGQQARDRIAAEPMLQVDPVDAREGDVASTPAETMTIPAATKVGPADVPTGFPQTPHGAVGQLAAISRVVMEGMSIPHANTVHEQWALPGAPEAGQWRLTENVRAFLESAGISGQDAGSTSTMTVTPVAAQVKGHDGDEWVLACVLFDVTAVVEQEAKTGWGHCERMQWDNHSNAWKIAPGQQPAIAPSTWPGTTKAIEAGWRTWVSPDES
ncbi:hypothetical protein NYE39_16920 [Janibacter sp. FSL W8-0316]|uniref:hypothetical protein n=1 Tax=Janibacter sp. FSL W8-0316 TaxID=2975325 RepID=UPI0030F8892A